MTTTGGTKLITGRTRRRAIRAARAVAAVAFVCSFTGALAQAEQVKETHKLLGAQLEIVVESPDLETGQNRIRDAIAVAAVLESQLAPGVETNDLGKLNANAGLGPRQVPLDLYRLLALSKVMTRSTGDAFDVTVGPLLRLRQPGQSGEPERGPRLDMDQALSLVGADKIALHPQGRVELPIAGMSVDLSAIVRGYVLERIATQLRRSGTTSALLAFGDSTIVAIGPPEGEPPHRVWVPRGRAMAGSVALRDLALATSRAHRGTDDERPPIVDPRSGRYVEADRQASVVARNAAIAEAWSTALVVDPDGALVLLDEPRDVEAVVFDEHGEHASPRFLSYVSWIPARQPGEPKPEQKLSEQKP